MGMRNVMNSKWFIPTVSGVVSFGGGVAAGYFLAKYRHVDAKQELLEEKLDEATQKTQEFTELTLDFTETMEKAVRRLDEATVETRGRSTFVINAEDLDPEGGEKLVNVFVNTDPEWDFEAETAARVPGKPYVIHRDEFFGDELGWDSQSTLTWYAQDGVLTGDRDEVIYNVGDYIGDELRFGHGSGDPNVFYVRNEKFHAEYEVLCDPGSYEINVLGGQVEQYMEDEDLKHARCPGKFRGD